MASPGTGPTSLAHQAASSSTCTRRPMAVAMFTSASSENRDTRPRSRSLMRGCVTPHRSAVDLRVATAFRSKATDRRIARVLQSAAPGSPRSVCCSAAIAWRTLAGCALRCGVTAHTGVRLNCQ